MANSDGIPGEFYIHAGAESEQADRRGLPLDLPVGSSFYTGVGYTGYLAEDLLSEANGSQQRRAQRKDSKRPHHLVQSFLIRCFCKRIETTFRQLTARSPKQLHAVTAAGFALKITLFIFVHPLRQAGL